MKSINYRYQATDKVISGESIHEIMQNAVLTIDNLQELQAFALCDEMQAEVKEYNASKAKAHLLTTANNAVNACANVSKDEAKRIYFRSCVMTYDKLNISEAGLSLVPMDITEAGSTYRMSINTFDKEYKKIAGVKLFTDYNAIKTSIANFLVNDTSKNTNVEFVNNIFGKVCNPLTRAEVNGKDDCTGMHTKGVMDLMYTAGRNNTLRVKTSNSAIDVICFALYAKLNGLPVMQYVVPDSVAKDCQSYAVYRAKAESMAEAQSRYKEARLQAIAEAKAKKQAKAEAEAKAKKQAEAKAKAEAKAEAKAK